MLARPLSKRFSAVSSSQNDYYFNFEEAFENLGWKVYRSPEVATLLIRGGVDFSQLEPSHGTHILNALF